jgi:hypothetical protein
MFGSRCLSSCGGGTRDRRRTCPVSFPGGLFSSLSPCGAGETDGTEECNADVACPSPPEWTEWAEWSECTKTCGGGSQKRARKCVVPRGSKNIQDDDNKE